MVKADIFGLWNFFKIFETFLKNPRAGSLFLGGLYSGHRGNNLQQKIQDSEQKIHNYSGEMRILYKK